MLSMSSHPNKCLKYNIILAIVLLITTTNVSSDSEPTSSLQVGGPAPEQSQSSGGVPGTPAPNQTNYHFPDMQDFDMSFGQDTRKGRSDRNKLPFNVRHRNSKYAPNRLDKKNLGAFNMKGADLRDKTSPTSGGDMQKGFQMRQNSEKSLDKMKPHMKQIDHSGKQHLQEHSGNSKKPKLSNRFGKFGDDFASFNNQFSEPNQGTFGGRPRRLRIGGNKLKNSQDKSLKVSVEPSIVSKDDNLMQKKRCRIFEDNSIKNIDIKTISGDWNQLYAFVPNISQKCIQISLKPLDEKVLEFKQINNCVNILKGELSRVPSTSKLMLNIGGKSSSFWTLDTGIQDIILVYQCSEPENEVNPTIRENYKLFSRQKQTSDTVLQTINNLLSRITNGVSLTPTPHIDCNCDQQKPNESGSSQKTLEPLSQPIIPKQSLVLNSNLPNQQVQIPNQQVKIPNQQVKIPNQAQIPNQQAQIPNQQAQISNQQVQIPKTDLSHPINGNSPIGSGISQIQQQSSASIPSSPISANQEPNSPRSSLNVDPNTIQNQIFEPNKRCRKFEYNSIKNLDFNMMSGDWDEVYASETSNKKCSYSSVKPINDKQMDFIQHNGCDIKLKGRVTKMNFTSKLTMNFYNKTTSYWTIDLGVKDKVLVYQCDRPDNDPNAFIFENYRLFVRQKPLSETDFQNIQKLLSQITSGVSLLPIPHKECSCGPHKAPIPTIAPKEVVPTTKPNILNFSAITPVIPVPSNQTKLSTVPLSQVPIVPSPIHKLGELNQASSSNQQAQIPKINLPQTNINNSPIGSGMSQMQQSSQSISAKQEPNSPRPSLNANAKAIHNQILPKESVPTPKANISSISPVPIITSEQGTIVPPRQGDLINGCPAVEFVKLGYNDWERLSGMWYSQWYSQEHHEDLYIELGKADPRTPSTRWVIKHEGTHILTGIMDLNATNGQTICKICGGNDTIFSILSTDFENNFITYECNPNTKSYLVGAWSRVKALNMTISEDLAQQTSDIMTQNGLKADLYGVEQFNASKPSPVPNEALVCKDIRDKALLDVDVAKLRGNWRTILLNVDDNRCIGIKENKSALTDPNNRDEFWFDVYTEKGVQGLGRIKSYENRRLTQFNAGVPGERNFTILDTDYLTYFVYYECNIIEFEGIPHKIVEFGLMSRKASVEPQTEKYAIHLFNKNGLGNVHVVDQKGCHFNQESIIPKENHCKGFQTYDKLDKDIDLDMLIGKWWGHYLTTEDSADSWIELERNSDFLSNYTHVIKIVFDESVLTLSVRKCLITGNIMIKNEFSSTEELQLIFKTEDYTSHLFIYKCHELPGIYADISKFGIFSRNCDLNDISRNKGKLMAQQLGLSDKLHHVKQFQCLLDYKYETRLLSKKCIQFHDSDIVEPNLSLMVGQWDRHLMSEKLPHRYDYAIVTHSENIIDYTVYPLQYHSRKRKVNGTSLMKTISVTSKYVVLGNEAFIGVDYKSFILKYSCAQYERKGQFVLKELLILSLRPQSTARLANEPDLFVKILNSIPEKSLSRISHLIPKLTHQLNQKYTNFGESVINSVDNRLKMWRQTNGLSYRSDREVYKFLMKSCTHFDRDEQILFDISTIVSTNWTLDYTNIIDERLPFNRLLIKKQSHNSYELSLYDRNKLTTLSDSYYDKEDKTFWTYTEGRRARKTYLFSNIDYRIVYSCEERYVDGTLRAQEILHFFSAENTLRPRDWFSYLESLATHIKLKTLGKVTHVLENMIPAFSGCHNNNTPPNTLKSNFRSYLLPKLQFEEQILGKPHKSSESDVELFSTLNKVCEYFEDDEVVDLDTNRYSGHWSFDWSTWHTPIQGKGQYSYDVVSNGSDFTENFYFKPLDNGDRKLFANSYYKRDKESGHFLKSAGSPYYTRSQATILWTDYDYMIGHQCFENEKNGEMSISEVLSFSSRNGNTDLSHYIQIISENLSQKTTSKLYHSINSMKPFNYLYTGKYLKIINDNIIGNKTLSENTLKDRMSFAEEIYLYFMPKGLAVEKINRQIVGKDVGEKNADEVIKTLSSICRQFDDSEIVQVQINASALFLGNWRYDYYTRTRFIDEFDNFEVDYKGRDSYEIRFYLGTDLKAIQESKPIPGSHWVRSALMNNRYGIMATLYLDEQLLVQYWCHENDIDGVLTDSEGLIFSSRGPKKTPMDVYLKKLLQNVSPSALSKVTELVANLRPIDKENLYRDCSVTKPKSYKFSKNSVINHILQKNCIYFNQRYLVEPNFTKLFAYWKVRLSNTVDFHKPYDTIQWYDGIDRYYSKLRLDQKFQCKTKLAQIEDTNYYEESFDRKRAIQAILYTDYSDVMVIYSCKENIYDYKLSVIENLKLLIRNDSKKLSMDLQDFQQLVSTKLIPNIYSKIAKFIPSLKYVYNNNEGIPGSPSSNSIIKVPEKSISHNIMDQQGRFSPKQISRVKHVAAQNVPLSQSTHMTSPILANNRQLDEECPNLDNTAQNNIKFHRLVGHWDAIYTSNTQWDRGCIFTEDIYDNNTNSIIQMKSTGGKRHKVVIRHSGINGRQHIVIDKTIFQSWILATDYDTYRLFYTCFVKREKGHKKRIELERLYVRDFDTKGFDTKILETLRQKSVPIGKALQPIDRSQCQTGPAVRAPGA